MKWIISLKVSLTVALTINLADFAAVKNEIGVLRASGDIAHSLLELLAGGRMNVDENQSHFTALRARLQDRPQQFGISKFDGNIMNKIAANVDDITQIQTDQMQSTPGPKHSDELNFVEDTDEKNFVTEPYPPKTRSRQWMIHRVDPLRTTTVRPPSTTQFTLFPTFPTLFPPLFGAITPMNPFVLPQITTPGPIFNLPTATVPTPTTQKAIERESENVKIDSKIDEDLLKPYQPEQNKPTHRSKIVGSRLQFKLGEKANKQEGGEEGPEQSTTVNENQETGATESLGAEETTQPSTVSVSSPTDDGDGKSSGSGNKPEEGDSQTTRQPNSGSPSTDDGDSQTTRQPNSGSSPADDGNSQTTRQPNSGNSPTDEGSGSGKSSGSGNNPNEESSTPGTPSPKSSGSGSGDNDDASGSGKSSGSGDDSSGNGSGAKCTDGRWSEWKMKLPCSAECGACGRLQKERECLSFKNGKGCPCTGDYKVIEPCNIEVCRYPKPSCCPPYDLIHVDGVFACGPQEKNIMAEFKNSTRFKKH